MVSQLIIDLTDTCRMSGRSGGGRMYKEIALSLASFSFLSLAFSAPQFLLLLLFLGQPSVPFK